MCGQSFRCKCGFRRRRRSYTCQTPPEPWGSARGPKKPEANKANVECCTGWERRGCKDQDLGGGVDLCDDAQGRLRDDGARVRNDQEGDKLGDTLRGRGIGSGLAGKRAQESLFPIPSQGVFPSASLSAIPSGSRRDVLAGLSGEPLRQSRALHDARQRAPRRR